MTTEREPGPLEAAAAIADAAAAAYHAHHRWTGAHDGAEHWESTSRAAIAAYLRAASRAELAASPTNRGHERAGHLWSLAAELDATPQMSEREL